MSSVISTWADSLSSLAGTGPSSSSATATSLLIALTLVYLTRRLFKSLFEPKPLVTVSASQEAREMAEEPKKTTDSAAAAAAAAGGGGKPMMQPPRTDLAPPKDDPFTLGQLKAFDGSDPSKPIYVSIKGTVFDVTHKKDVYGTGKSYNIFAGKDGSKGLGMSSLKPEDAVPDYSQLPANERKVLDDWHSFFEKRYNVVGKVVDLPPAVANL